MKTVYLIAGGAVVAAGLMALMRGKAKAIGFDMGAGAVDMVDGVVTGTVESVGLMVGIPKTNMSECERAKAEGRTWDASFACPAADFIKYAWS